MGYKHNKKAWTTNLRQKWTILARVTQTARYTERDRETEIE